jgi:hypothetical protein
MLEKPTQHLTPLEDIMKLAGSTALDITDPASVETAAKATDNVTCRRAPTNGDAEDTA